MAYVRLQFDEIDLSIFMPTQPFSLKQASFLISCFDTLFILQDEFGAFYAADSVRGRWHHQAPLRDVVWQWPGREHYLIMENYKKRRGVMVVVDEQ